MSATRRLLVVWILLLLLLAGTYAGSLFLSGPVGVIVSMAVAFTKVGLILWFFMHLREVSGLSRIAALAAGFWLTILFAFVFLDYLTRMRP